MHYFDFSVSENMHRAARLVIFDYSIANFHPWGDLKNSLFYAIMAIAKNPPRLELAARARRDEYTVLGCWPQSWPFTGLEYVGIMDFVARKSTVFGRKSTKTHSKWGKRPLLLSLGARCRRFESCHSYHMNTPLRSEPPGFDFNGVFFINPCPITIFWDVIFWTLSD